jgi:ribosomal protein S18 acetylase RimI-like enzyme
MRSAFDQRLLSRIEDAGLNASAPPQQRWLDGWLLRLSPGKAKRARCVNAVAEGRLPLADKLACCEAAYAQAGLPFFVRVTPFTQPAGLDAELERQGWARIDDTRVMVLPAYAAVAADDWPAGTRLQPLDAEAFAQTVGALRGSPLPQRAAHAQRLLNSPVPYSGWALRAHDEVLACGQFALEDDLVGLYDVFTAPAYRGRGWARRLCRALLTEAHGRGARTAYLQVDAHNAAARASYRGLGFADAYAYHYRCLDALAT